MNKLPKEHVDNVGQNELADRLSQYYLDREFAYFEGPPKASKFLSVEQLEADGMRGIYRQKIDKKP